MDLHAFLTQHADAIVGHATDAIATRKLKSYLKVGTEISRGKLRALFDRVVEGVQTHRLDPVVEHAERVGKERYESGFEFVEVQSAFNLLEEAIWNEMLAEYPAQEMGVALGMVATLLGAAKDRLACTYLSLATHAHVGTLDLQSLFRGTQNTGGGQS